MLPCHNKNNTRVHPDDHKHTALMIFKEGTSPDQTSPGSSGQASSQQTIVKVNSFEDGFKEEEVKLNLLNWDNYS